MPVETSLQTAGYAEAWNEREEPKVKKRAGLQLFPDGTQAELYPYNAAVNKNDFNYFLNSLNVHRWIRQHRRAA